VRVTGPTYLFLLKRYVTIIMTSRPTKIAGDTLKFVDVTGKVGGANDQMKQLIENNCKKDHNQYTVHKTDKTQQTAPRVASLVYSVHLQWLAG
jgi:hypothetical protein